MCLKLTLNIFHTFFSISIVDFEQVDVSWAVTKDDTSAPQSHNNIPTKFFKDNREIF